MPYTTLCLNLQSFQFPRNEYGSQQRDCISHLILDDSLVSSVHNSKKTTRHSRMMMYEEVQMQRLKLEHKKAPDEGDVK